MNKSELIQNISNKNSQLSLQDVEIIVNGILKEISKQLANDGRVEFRNFGAFDLKTRKASIARNPKTGETFETEEKKVPYFKAGKLLKERIDNKK
ncbi:MAG: HU family DNA-binding protein [Alphaproteobacteria bacterium]